MVGKFSLKTIVKRKLKRYVNTLISKHPYWQKIELYNKLLPAVIKPDSNIKSELDLFVKSKNITKPINYNISKNDLMFLITLRQEDLKNTFLLYLELGIQAKGFIEDLIKPHYNSLSEVNSFLDFAAGHGRLTRVLLNDIDASKIVVSDIKPDAMDFQKAEFGVDTILSEYNPNDFKIDKTFNVIFVGSLFTHLPKDLFINWLHKLVSLLSNNGVLIFTVHHIDLFPGKLDTNDFHYVTNSEDEVLSEVEGAISDKESYGTSFTTPEFVQNQLNDCKDKLKLDYHKGMWNNIQDVYTIYKE